MREIKFRRAHFKDEAKTILSDVTEWGFIGDAGFYSPAFDTKCRYVTDYQYTGLKDKNGKEIYEGDIILLHEYGGVCKEVEYRNGSFGVNGFNWWVEKCEVVGNVYENPELIK